MNIFTVLSQGKGNLNEENLSAFLAHLLDPRETHGLADSFLRKFIKTLESQLDAAGRFDSILKGRARLSADVVLEQAYSVEGRKRVVDIVVHLFAPIPSGADDSPEELHRILIENKVNPAAASEQQLREEYLGALEDLSGEEVPITVVFITPPGDHSGLHDEYNALAGELRSSDRKVWLRWASGADSSNDVVSVLRQVLNDEQEARIEPINAYVRHTLKAFVLHLSEGRAGSGLSSRAFRASHPLGNVERTITVDLSDGSYRVDRYSNRTVRVANVDSGAEVPAKPILRQIIVERSLDIDLHLTTGREKNTRNMGNQVILKLLERKTD